MTPTLASLKASQTAKPDQIRLYGIVAEAAVALQRVADNFRYRELRRPGLEPSREYINEAIQLADDLHRELVSEWRKLK